MNIEPKQHIESVPWHPGRSLRHGPVGCPECESARRVVSAVLELAGNDLVLWPIREDGELHFDITWVSSRGAALGAILLAFDAVTETGDHASFWARACYLNLAFSEPTFREALASGIALHSSLAGSPKG